MNTGDVLVLLMGYFFTMPLYLMVVYLATSDFAGSAPGWVTPRRVARLRLLAPLWPVMFVAFVVAVVALAAVRMAKAVRGTWREAFGAAPALAAQEDDPEVREAMAEVEASLKDRPTGGGRTRR